ncbi:DNA topoisomerase IB [Niveibacterium sp. SC-1]|uniref:DNA topoisomerase IB n=1 Tax=Niveibacterium sp. SC-1 TaxID=3135646 RepID=UPI00311E92A4
MAKPNGFPMTGKRSRGSTAADPADLLHDGPGTAREVGLRYVSETEPGCSRSRHGKGFGYRDSEGRPLRAKEELARIRALAIPPAWTDVWICRDARGHIQATGRDARGRKQYRYHADWRSLRDQTKYGQMIAFGEALPALRARLEQDLRQRGLPRDKVLAVAVQLLDLTRIRVGNTEYARDNASFGLTTLRDEHVDVDGTRIRFHFRGKSGVHHEVAVSDRRLARIVRQMVDLPGEELFQYSDEEGLPHPIGSADVNDYLRGLTGADFSAKDFRTWGGTVLAVRHLLAQPVEAAVQATRQNLLQAIDQVARALGNTRALCRKCYVHPAVIEAFLAGVLHESTAKLTKPLAGLSEEEALTLHFLQTRAQ